MMSMVAISQAVLLLTSVAAFTGHDFLNRIGVREFDEHFTNENPSKTVHATPTHVPHHARPAPTVTALPARATHAAGKHHHHHHDGSSLHLPAELHEGFHHVSHLPSEIHEGIHHISHLPSHIHDKYEHASHWIHSHKPFHKHCSVDVNVQIGEYSLRSHIFADPKKGWQCTKLLHKSHSGNKVKWESKWTWEHDLDVIKAYPHLHRDMEPFKLSEWDSIITEWEYKFGGHFNADTTYLMALSDEAKGKEKFHVKLVVGQYGVRKTPEHYGKEIGTVSYKNKDYVVYYDEAGRPDDSGVPTFSFVVSHTHGLTAAFRGDFMLFFKYLIKHGHVSPHQYLLYVKAGIVTFRGHDAHFKTTYYRIAKNTVKKREEVLGEKATS